MPDSGIPATAWQPPQLDPAEAAFNARLSRRRSPARVAGWELYAGLPAAIEDAEHHGLTLDGHPAGIELPRSLVDAVLLTLDPAAPAATGVPRRLLLELALEDVLAALDAVLPVGEPLEGETPVAVGLLLQAGEASWDAVLHLSRPAADALMTSLEVLEPAPVVPDIRVPLSLRTGACDLLWPDLRGLQPGDVLLPSAGLDGTVLLVAHERLVWQVRADPAGAMTVTSSRRHAAELGLEDWMMDDAAPQPLADAELDDLPVRLVFEAGRVEVSIGELSLLGPGHIFTVPGRAGLVDIVSGGRRIGQGELVQVGDAAGVRVLRLSGTKPNP